MAGESTPSPLKIIIIIIIIEIKIQKSTWKPVSHMWGYFILQQRIKALLLLIKACAQSLIALIGKKSIIKAQA